MSRIKLSVLEKQRARALLYRFLSTPSINGSSGELTKAKLIQESLLSAGLDVKLQVLDERRGNVVCHLSGREGGRRLVLNGHLDTVKYGDLAAWHSDPAQPKEREERVYARGASDMQGGLAALVYAFIWLKEKAIEPICNLSFLATCDEEASGAGALACSDADWLQEADCFLVAEPTSLALGLSEKGCHWLRFNVYGKTAHGAYPGRGCNAIEQGCQLLMRIKERLVPYVDTLLGHSTMQINQVEGGIAPNMTADFACFVVDVRNTPDLDDEKLISIIAEEIASAELRSDGFLRVEFEVLNSRLALRTSMEDPWVKRLGAAYSRQVGEEADFCGVSFFTDASLFVKSNCDSSFILFGPGDPELCHQANESLSLTQFESFIEILLSFLVYEGENRG